MLLVDRWLHEGNHMVVGSEVGSRQNLLKSLVYLPFLRLFLSPHFPHVMLDVSEYFLDHIAKWGVRW